MKSNILIVIPKHTSIGGGVLPNRFFGSSLSSFLRGPCRANGPRIGRGGGFLPARLFFGRCVNDPATDPAISGMPALHVAPRRQAA